MKMRVLCLVMTVLLLFGTLYTPTYAANYDSDWRLTARTAKISFRDAQGELIPELSDLWINDSALSYDSSTVSYGDIDKLDYGSFDFCFSCVDYNYMIYGDGSNLPDADKIMSELTFGSETLEPDTVTCAITAKGYLQLDFLFENVNFFDGENKEAQVYIQYQKKSIEGDDTADFYKGELTVAFDKMLQPNMPTEEPKDEILKVEVLLPQTPQTETKVNAEKPYILIEQCNIGEGDESILSGSPFEVELLSKNLHSQFDLENVLMQVDTPGELCLLGPSNIIHIGKVSKGASFSNILSFETLSDAKSGYYVVSVKFSYEYVEGSSRKEESITQKFVVSLEQYNHFVEDEPEIDAEKPYILIEECTIDGGFDVVSAGSRFDVQLVAENLHPYLKAENVLMQVEVPDGLRLLNPSNTFYIGDVADGEGLVETLSFQSMPNVQSMDYEVSIEFHYEYVDGSTRKEESISQKIVVPLRQSSRFSVDELSLRPEYVVGEEQKLYSGYANMGKGKLYNVTATLQTELFSNVKILHLGNLDPGEGDSVEFVVDCDKIGTYPVEIRYSYETESGQYMEETVSGELNFVLPDDEIEEEPVIQYITEFPSAAQTVGKVSVDTVLLLFLSGLGLITVLIYLKKQK